MRRALFVLAVLALAVCVSLLSPIQARAELDTHSDSGCNHPEDPMNGHFINVKVHYPTRVGVTTLTGASATRFISNKYWDAAITASSPSYYQFSDGTSCHDHNSYVANHIPSNNGSHVRFWQGSTWTNIRAGVHHDYVCSVIGMSDTSDQFNTPRDNLLNYWGAFKDTSGHLNYEEYYVLDHPAKHWSKPCGFSTADDGYIATAQQTVSSESVNP